MPALEREHSQECEFFEIFNGKPKTKGALLAQFSFRGAAIDNNLARPFTEREKKRDKEKDVTFLFASLH